MLMVLLELALQLVGLAYWLGVGVFIGHHHSSWFGARLRRETRAIKAWTGLFGFALMWPVLLMWEAGRPHDGG